MEYALLILPKVPTHKSMLLQNGAKWPLTEVPFVGVYCTAVEPVVSHSVELREWIGYGPECLLGDSFFQWGHNKRVIVALWATDFI